MRTTGQIALLAAVLTVAGGCNSASSMRTQHWHDIRAAAEPLLTLDPEANWTACCNRLLELGPDSLAYLAAQPAMQHRAAPDDLSVALHTSLMRLLARPHMVPRLSIHCYETTLNVIHFEPKVRGRSLGSVVMLNPHPPRSLFDLYLADFDHGAAARVDVETDRQAMLTWWNQSSADAQALLRQAPWQPKADYLWPLLARRPADRWLYTPVDGVLLCAEPPADAALLNLEAYDYNITRAAAIWLGSSHNEEVVRALIELLSHASPTLAHNVVFALRHSPDRQIRDAIEGFDQAPRSAPADVIPVHASPRAHPQPLQAAT